ncbi:hypothetical protein VQ056_23540 [Paenibacillus sp. JTLBN-2024]
MQIKPVELKKKRHYQFAYVHPNKVVHQNVPRGRSGGGDHAPVSSRRSDWRMICTPDADYQILISKKIQSIDPYQIPDQNLRRFGA